MKYLKPEMEILEITADDIVTVSNVGGSSGSSGESEIDTGTGWN